MYIRFDATLALLASLVMINAQSLLSTLTQTYTLNVSHVGYNFLDNFSWETMDDPTHGRVNYVDLATALGDNLTFVSDSKFVMRADDTRQVENTTRGRDSVRIRSLAAYDDALFKGPWPNGGEIDIIEGVNLNRENLASQHTTPNCKMPKVRPQKGSTTSTSCDTSVNSNQGCGVSFPEQDSYGSSFNAGGGGFYIMEKSSTKGVSVWLLSRWDLLVLDGEPILDLVLLSEPDAHFPMQDKESPEGDCSYSEHFDAHDIVFNLTFCGDWAGSVWATSPCAAKAPTCEDFVNDYPQEFAEAYWEINSLRYIHSLVIFCFNLMP
ncbi:glycoside hydrolase family 16 protein [Suillus ampliporus]|nr:glycoside hydrolase family 16 protein [Suillus ampliporus]